ncbi:MAG: 1-acyl-sn-glycerol-3-phosphate acyltransferase [Planctomycetes bacterium]|nr:1-acyl-sn-glycerol-3-phosphate acyltransferase [Planctomycetota bacterium]
MQQLVFETPYRFIPPTRGRIWPAVLAGVVGPYLKRLYGVTSYEVRGAEKIRASIEAGHGIVTPANHSRACDPLACGWLTRAVRHPFFCMASWHTFMGSKFDRFMIRRCGAFSIYREGPDHASLSFAVDALVSAERPVMLFSEGAITNCNDRIAPLMDGVVLMARMAARRAAKATPARRVVVHPVIFKYFFQGNLEKTLSPVIVRLEKLLELSPGTGSVVDRMRRLEDALLAKREVQFFGAPQRSSEGERAAGDRAGNLVERILQPLEAEWSPKETPGRGRFARLQALRGRILPDMVAGKVTEEERRRRWKQLDALYHAQCLNTHPPDCLEGDQEPERIIEAMHRLEEDLTDRISPHGPTHLVIESGDAIEVETTRQRGAGEDPLTTAIHQQLTQILQGIERPK